MGFRLSYQGWPQCPAFLPSLSPAPILLLSPFLSLSLSPSEALLPFLFLPGCGLIAATAAASGSSHSPGLGHTMGASSRGLETLQQVPVCRFFWHIIHGVGASTQCPTRLESHHPHHTPVSWRSRQQRRQPGKERECVRACAHKHAPLQGYSPDFYHLILYYV